MMTPQQLADRLVALCRAGQFDQTQRELYAPDATSIEAHSVPTEYRTTRGLDAIVAKGADFRARVREWHSATVSDAVVAGRHIALRICLDTTQHDGTRAVNDEVAVYTVEEGRVVQEQFFY